VLANMDSALTYLARGMANYVKCYADTFHFYPTPNDQAIMEAQGRPTVYDNWTKTVERDVMDLILTQARNLDITFVSRQVIADETLFKIWEERYRLALQRARMWMWELGVPVASDASVRLGVMHVEPRYLR
jgi:hypothetical protein